MPKIRKDKSLQTLLTTMGLELLKHLQTNRNEKAIFRKFIIPTPISFFLEICEAGKQTIPIPTGLAEDGAGLWVSCGRFR